MDQRFRIGLYLVLLWTTSCLTAPSPAVGQVPDKPSHVQPLDVSGDWQVTWQGRLGAEQCALHLEQDGETLTGTLKTLHGVSSIAGTVDKQRIFFEVQFGDPHPFTTRFTGNADGGKIEGTSQAVGIGGSGAYLGHAGEIVQPDHPWSATHLANQPTQAVDTRSDSNPHARQ